MGNLPFAKDNNLRKWQCFVCGKQYTDFDTFKKHIIESHEAGREYIICPLERCGAPVRDMKMHFRAKHPTEAPPSTGMMKAMIWKDQTGTGKVKTRKPSFREGYFVSNKNHGKEMHYRSGMECQIYECLENIPEVISYHVEPFKGGIAYVAPDGRQHQYFPDLSIQFSDGHLEIWEIKPASQTSLEVNEAKWSAANAFCTARGWEFIVITEVGLGKLKRRAKLEKALNEG